MIAAIGGVGENEGAMITEVQGVIMPGLVQAHAHLDQTLLDRYLVADTDPGTFRRVQVAAWLKALGEEELRVQAESAFARGLSTGTTFFGDAGRTAGRRVAIEAAQKLGVRLVAPLDIAESPSIERDLDVLGAELETSGAAKMVRPAIFAGDAERTPMSLLSAAAEASKKRNLPLIVHLGALPGDDRGLKRLERAGAIHRGLSVVHGTGRSLLSPRTVAAMAASGASVLLTPAFDLLMGAPSPAIEALVAAKVNLGLASETGATRTRLDLFREVRLLYRWLIGRVPEAASHALEIATRGGATALGVASGSIQVGQPADLMLVDVEAEPNEDHELVARRIIVQGESSIVRKIWVAGQVVYSDGRVTKADPPDEETEEALRTRIGFALEGLKKKRQGMTQQLADRLAAKLRLSLGWHEGRLPFLETPLEPAPKPRQRSTVARTGTVTPSATPIPKKD